VFGMERSAGDEALRATRASLTLRANVPGARVAVATCRMVRAARGLAGDAVERGTSALEAPCEGVRVDPATARLVGSRFVVAGPDDAPWLTHERNAADGSVPTLFG